MKSKRRQTRSRKNRAHPQRVKRSLAMAPRGPATQRTGPLPKILSINRKQQSGISESGMAFLKCAFASPDFSVDPGKGIPDQFHGRTLSIRDCNTTALSFTPGKDTYIVIAPVPGYAYFKAEVDIGVNPNTFVGTTFPTYATNFGTGTTGGINFSKFRYASCAVGLYPTSNMMQFSGSIQVWRVDLNLAEALAGTVGTTSNSVVSKRIQGLQGIVSIAPRDNYSGSFIDGCYTFAFDKTQDFEWCDFVSGVNYLQEFTTATVGPFLSGSAARPLTGLGNVNTIVIKVSTPTGAVNSSILRVWNCIELQPDTNSALFQYSGVSPNYDPVAMELYHKLKMQFPVAVPAAQNANFWEKVLGMVNRAVSIGKTVGQYASAAGSVLSAIPIF